MTTANDHPQPRLAPSRRDALPPRILIAGIGNIFLGDDAFGCEVVKLLLAEPLPVNVKITDFGIRSLDLTYALLESWDAVILIDAVPRGEAPGTLYVIEPDAPSVDNATASPGMPLIDAHGMDPAKVLSLVASMGGTLPRLVLVGCEPTLVDESDMQIGLSDAVTAAIPHAIDIIKDLVTKLSAERFTGDSTHAHTHATDPIHAPRL